MASSPSKGVMMAEGMPPSKQQQHEEALAPLDDQERRAVQKRLMRRNHGSGQSATTRSTARDRYNDPAFRSPKAGQGRSARGAQSSRSVMTTSRSMMTTARSSSPTGRYHPDPTRRLELRKVREPNQRPRPPPAALPRHARTRATRHTRARSDTQPSLSVRHDHTGTDRCTHMLVLCVCACARARV